MNLFWSNAVVAVLAAATAPAILTGDQVEAVKSAYRRLSPREVEAHPATALPEAVSLERIDVSDRIRSASFGHQTTLLVHLSGADGGAPAPVEFWVEHGRSTNSPARLFGPFAMAKPR